MIANIYSFVIIIQINHQNVIHKGIDKSISDTYVQSKEINELFKEILIDTGYNIRDVTNIVLTDKD